LFSSGVAIYLRPAFANLSSMWVTLTTLGLAVAISILNVRTNALITGAFLAIEVGALLLLAVLGFLHPAHSLGDLLTHPIRLDSAGTLVAVSGGIVALATASAAWALAGANLAIPLSEEMKAPRTVGLLVMLIFTISTLLIMAPVLGTLVGARDLRAIMQAESPFLAFLRDVTSPLLATAVGVAIAAAIFNATIAGVVGASRMVYSSGRDGVWDRWTNRALASLHPRFNSPWIAALVVGATSMAVSLLSVHTLLILNASTFAAVYALLGLGLYRGRRLGLTGKVGYRAPFFPLTPILAIFTSIGLAIAQYFDVESGRPGLLVTAILLLLASSYYHWILSRRPGGWRLMGPASPDEITQ
jgi:amino acid transporter